MQRDRHKKSKCSCTQVDVDKTIDKFEKLEGYKCKECHHVLNSMNSIYKHFKTSCKKSKESTTYPCEACDKVFRYKSKLEEHSKCHNRPKYYCTNCDKDIKRHDHYEKHIKNCTDENFAPTMANISISPPSLTHEEDLDFEITPFQSISSANSNQMIQLIDNNSVVVEDCATPPRRTQIRQSQQRKRLNFRLDSLLDTVDESSRKTVLQQQIVKSDSSEGIFRIWILYEIKFKVLISVYLYMKLSCYISRLKSNLNIYRFFCVFGS